MRYKYHTLLYIGLLPLFAACSSNDGEGIGTYEGFPQQVNLSAATISVSTSRASGNNTEVWAGTERIAVHMEVSNPVENAGFKNATYKYIPDSMGTLLTAAREDSMFYFRSPNDPDRTCVAWYWPFVNDKHYSDQSPAGKNQIIALPVDQKATSHAANDLLYAAPTTIAYESRNKVYSLLFCHQLTWVSFQVVADNYSQYDKSDLSATMGTETEPLIYQATFSAPSGKMASTGSRQVFGAYKLSGDTVKSGVIIPHQLEDPKVDGIICRYEAVLIPQKLSADGKTTHNLFNLTLDGKTYRYVSTMEFMAGVHYTFNLKIIEGDKPLLVLANATNWKNESVPAMEKLHVIAKLWDKGPFTGTTAGGNKWNNKENHGSENSANDWDDKETTGTTNSGNDWGDKEPANDSGTTGSSSDWGDVETNGSVKVDANSWKKGDDKDVSVSVGQDWQKEGTTQHY